VPARWQKAPAACSHWAHLNPMQRRYVRGYDPGWWCGNLARTETQRLHNKAAMYNSLSDRGGYGTTGAARQRSQLARAGGSLSLSSNDCGRCTLQNPLSYTSCASMPPAIFVEFHLCWCIARACTDALQRSCSIASAYNQTMHRQLTCLHTVI
jgi:hypothetical protein